MKSIKGFCSFTVIFPMRSDDTGTHCFSISNQRSEIATTRVQLRLPCHIIAADVKYGDCNHYDSDMNAAGFVTMAVLQKGVRIKSLKRKRTRARKIHHSWTTPTSGWKSNLYRDFSSCKFYFRCNKMARSYIPSTIPDDWNCKLVLSG